MFETRVIFLHGAPAVGKLTVAKALKELTPARLIDNHIVIDFAKSVLDFGAPGFFELVRESRILAIRYAVSAKVPVVLITSCYSEPEDEPQLQEIEEELTDPSKLLPVFLHCSVEAQHARVGNPDRTARGKLNDVASLNEFECQWNFVPMLRKNCLQIDTGEHEPLDSAQLILRHFGIVNQTKLKGET